jgi:hypothetical protein
MPNWTQRRRGGTADHLNSCGHLRKAIACGIKDPDVILEIDENVKNRDERSSIGYSPRNARDRALVR